MQSVQISAGSSSGSGFSGGRRRRDGQARIVCLEAISKWQAPQVCRVDRRKISATVVVAAKTVGWGICSIRSPNAAHT